MTLKLRWHALPRWPSKSFYPVTATRRTAMVAQIIGNAGCAIQTVTRLFWPAQTVRPMAIGNPEAGSTDYGKQGGNNGTYPLSQRRQHLGQGTAGQWCSLWLLGVV